MDEDIGFKGIKEDILKFIAEQVPLQDLNLLTKKLLSHENLFDFIQDMCLEKLI